MQIYVSASWAVFLASIGAPKVLSNLIGSDTVLVAMVSLSAFFLVINFPKKIMNRQFAMFGAVFPLLILVVLLFADSVFRGHPDQVFSVIVRLLACCVLLAMAVVFAQENIDSSYSVIGWLAIVGFAVPLIGLAPFVDGFSGQHYFKFFCVVAFVAAVAKFVECQNKLDPFIYCWLLVSALSLILILQRGAVVSTIVALLTLVLLRGWVRLSYLLPLSIGILILGVVGIEFSDMLIDYFFFGNFGPKEITAAILEGSFSLEMIRSRGRLDMAHILLQHYEIGAFGYGYGTSKELIGASFFDGREVHNDGLVFLVDVGVVGALLAYGVMLWPCLFARWYFRRVCGYVPLNTDVGIALLVGMLSWTWLSNVLIYATVALALPYVLMFAYHPKRENV